MHVKIIVAICEVCPTYYLIFKIQSYYTNKQTYK